MVPHDEEVSERREKKGPSGVGGWLQLLIAGMLLGPIYIIGRTNYDFSQAEKINTQLLNWSAWSQYKILTWIAVLIFCGISIFGGFQLLMKRTSAAVQIAKVVLWFNFPISVIAIGIIIPLLTLESAGDTVAGEAVLDLLVSFIAVLIWTVYLNKSKRVRNTYVSCIPKAMPAGALFVPEYSNEAPLAQETQKTPGEVGAPAVKNTGLISAINWVFGISAVILFGVAAVILADGLSTTGAAPNQVVASGQTMPIEQVPLTLIVVAAKDVEAGTPLGVDNLGLVQWPTDRVPQGAFYTIQDVVGRVAVGKLVAGQPLISAEP